MLIHPIHVYVESTIIISLITEPGLVRVHQSITQNMESYMLVGKSQDLVFQLQFKLFDN